MAPAEPRRLRLDVCFEPEPIQGRLYDAEGGVLSNRSFSGWLGLIAAIEAAGKAGSAPEQAEGR